VLLSILLVFFVLYPIVNTLVRYATLASALSLWAYLLWLSWPRHRLRAGWLGASAMLLGLCFVNGPGVSDAVLRDSYSRALARYEGTPYVWGGENWLGIDCSGLVRAAMIDTQLRHGLLGLSPQYLRQAFRIWFYDAGADTLAAGFRQQTRVVLNTPSLNALDHSQIQPGDFMVDNQGVHTMIYLGDQTWIEADPVQMKVIKVKVPSTIGWFKIPARIVRWRQLETSSGLSANALTETI
ncbi:MAG: hypothetical protein CVV27_15600, partial [Candidatus Melainabacteria bacterium HGW-Melainabacteria-1]